MRSSRKVQPALVPVVLSGGSGTRLWPLSREARPKQFLPLVGATSLFQQTLLRVQRLDVDARRPIVVCNAGHRDYVAAQSKEVGIEPQAIVLEPIGRNTAPAVAVAALFAAQVDSDPLLLVLPADHVIADGRAFGAAVRVAMEAAQEGRLVTFAIVPDRPETGYGYIRRGAARSGWAELDEFKEKPDRATAEAYVASGEYGWNSGMFLFAARQLLAEMRTHAPDIVAACERVVAAAKLEGGQVRLGAEFAQCPSNSIDRAVMEKTSQGAVVTLDAGWSDVGSWTALHEVLARDAAGNATSGDVLLEACRNTYVVGNRRLVAAVGLENIVIVETDDAVLVVDRERAQDVKNIVDALKAAKRSET
jgi:mannose-1-phosphate guanylyltransferase / mannose-6-phosphate isomerase